MGLEASADELRDALVRSGGVVHDELPLPAIPDVGYGAYPERVRFEVSVRGPGRHTVVVTPSGLFVERTSDEVEGLGSVSGHTNHLGGVSHGPHGPSDCSLLEHRASRAGHVVDHLGREHPSESTVGVGNDVVRAFALVLARVSLARYGVAHAAELGGVLDRAGASPDVYYDLVDAASFSESVPAVYEGATRVAGLLADGVPIEWLARHYPAEE